MAILIRGKSVGSLRGRVIAAEDEMTGFPHFLSSPTDSLWSYSDGVFHAPCFASDPNAPQVQTAYLQWRTIGDSRPRNLKTDEEGRNWASSAFAVFRKEFQSCG